ncbi:gamma-glutamyl-gamma-aminobutyrate hydrolase family protein [Bacillus sp. 1P06AnD]|uniref:gamma-glutamyl-gamma-aminobutyrate hydrolase family protein n=1 Tax=Bacillus sp. 1P06AnD TaxID=3132208 RepID=UPI0039A0F35B
MKTNRPIIGITSSVLDIEIKGETNPCVQVNHQYVKAIKDTGGLPIVIPVGDEETAKQTIDLCDGLFLSSGEDVFPLYYDENPSDRLKMINVERDQMEQTLVKYAMEKKMPIIGTCRGLGTLNTALGGSMIQDIEKDHNAIKHNQKNSRKQPSHKIEIKTGSRLHQLMKSSSANVNSKHHQAIKEVAPSCKVAASAEDGVVEAIEGKDPSQFILGLQFHPEELYEKDEKMKNILTGFIEACKTTK